MRCNCGANMAMFLREVAEFSNLVSKILLNVP